MTTETELRDLLFKIVRISPNGLQKTPEGCLDLFAQDQNGSTLLHRAVNSGDVNLVAFLLNYSDGTIIYH